MAKMRWTACLLMCALLVGALCGRDRGGNASGGTGTTDSGQTEDSGIDGAESGEDADFCALRPDDPAGAAGTLMSAAKYGQTLWEAAKGESLSLRPSMPDAPVSNVGTPTDMRPYMKSALLIETFE